jgi:hypothetical protein
VVGESLGFLDRGPCPGAVGSADKRGRFSGVFEGIVGGCGGDKPWRKVWTQ